MRSDESGHTPKYHASNLAIALIGVARLGICTGNQLSIDCLAYHTTLGISSHTWLQATGCSSTKRAGSMHLATATACTAELLSGTPGPAEELSDNDESLPSEEWFVSLALGIRCDSTGKPQQAIDPATLRFSDRNLESLWWHKQAATALEDDRNDTVVFTSGTILTLIRLWYIGALSHSSTPTQDFYTILTAAIASFSTSVWHWILLRNSRDKYIVARQPWAMWTRLARCSFACLTTPHLFLAQPDSSSIMLSLVPICLTTGGVPDASQAAQCRHRCSIQL
jgi:hypothetical protein